jgi:hypothetical protein
MQENAVESMVEAARNFCAHVEAFDDKQVDAWLHTMASMLPRLHEAARELGAMQSVAVHERSLEDEGRFELFTRLYEALGERDGYNYEFDAREGQRLSGSLADDITDIYFDLKRGLELFEQYPAEPAIAASDWQQSFEFHWRHHLVDAERQLSRPANVASH